MRQTATTGKRAVAWRLGRAILILTIALIAPVVSSDRWVFAAQDMGARSYRIDVGGYKLYLTCVGSGSPTVVFSGGYIERWAQVQPAAGSFTRACAFDSAGMGMSGLGPLPLTVDDLSAQLGRVLSSAALSGPFVLVGEGVDGSAMRVYAGLHARLVVGLILVDAIHPHYFSRDSPQLFDGRDIDLKHSQQELLAAHALGTTPLIVMSHGVHLTLAPAIERSWTKYEHQFTSLSSRSIWVIARHSGYGIAETQPQVVSEAVNQVLLAWTTHSPVLGCRYWLPSAGAVCPGE